MKSGQRKILFLSVALPAFISSFFLTYMFYYGAATGGKEFGDETLKAFNGNGEFVGLQFRKNNFTVYISSRSEAAAKFFAGSALKAINAK
jgi:hypothetical protein